MMGARFETPFEAKSRPHSPSGRQAEDWDVAFVVWRCSEAANTKVAAWLAKELVCRNATSASLRGEAFGTSAFGFAGDAPVREGAHAGRCERLRNLVSVTSCF